MRTFSDWKACEHTKEQRASALFSWVLSGEECWLLLDNKCLQLQFKPFYKFGVISKPETHGHRCHLVTEWVPTKSWFYTLFLTDLDFFSLV